MILFAVSAEVSVGELFIAGVGPGLFIGGALILLVWCWAKIKGYGKRDSEGNTSVRIAVSDVCMLAIMIVLFMVWHFISRSLPFLSNANEGTHFALATLLTGLVGAVVPEL